MIQDLLHLAFDLGPDAALGFVVGQGLAKLVLLLQRRWRYPLLCHLLGHKEFVHNYENNHAVGMVCLRRGCTWSWGVFKMSFGEGGARFTSDLRSSDIQDIRVRINGVEVGP